MGHAYVANLGEFFINRLYAKGKLSIKEAALAAVKAGETLHASEGEYEDEGMIAHGLWEVIWRMIRPSAPVVTADGVTWPGPILIPVGPLTDRQVGSLTKYLNDDNQDWDDESEDDKSAFTVLDTIQWKFAKGWRSRYKDIIQHHVPDAVEN
jgi:hypothetical protein